MSIIPVLLFHLKEEWLPGGFVGVDVFFVISGYLITNLILRDCDRGKFSFQHFYQRRIARLFPAMALVVAFTFTACLLIYDRRFVGDNGPHMAESVLSVANIFSAHEDGGYFGIVKDVHPFLHFWSLSVEEQFYIFFPALLLLLWKFQRKRISLCLGLLLAASLAFCVLYTPAHQQWSFYMLPTRAWELLAGGLLASWEFHHRHWTKERHSIVAWAGLAMLLLSFAIVRGSYSPGAIALLPVLAAVSLIVSCTTSDNAVNRLLSTPVLVKIGQLSYVLYLWHLPIFCFVDYRLIFTLEWKRDLLKLALLLIATLLTSLLIENPARKKLNRRENRRYAFAFAALIALVFSPLGVWGRYWGWPEPKPRMVAGGGIAANVRAKNGDIAIIGDSQACSTASTLRDVAEEKGMRFNSLCVSSTTPLVNGETNAWDSSLVAVQHLRPDVLVIQMDWRHKAAPRERLVETLRILSAYAKKIVLISEYPTLTPGMPRQAIRNGLRLPYFEDTDLRREREQGNAILRSVGHEMNVSVVDADSMFTNPDGSVRIFDEHRQPFFFDFMHLSTRGVSQYKQELSQAVSR